MTDADETSLKSQWCLVGNIVDEHPSGEGGREVKSGTKHFSPGTKIYAFPAQWGDGYEKIIVIGRHRGSKDFVTMVIKSSLVTNWRAKVIYNPEVLRRLQEGVCRFWKPQNWKGEAEVIKFLKGLQKCETKARKLDPDEIPLQAMAKKDHGSIVLKCRTPEEAYLVCDELEKSDILAILPEEHELLAQFKANGYVEVKVSANFYGQLPDLRSSVEFQYKRLRAEKPLSPFGKLLGIGCGLMPFPGAFVFAWLLTSYKKNGYARMRRNLKFWFFVGFISWVLLITAMVVFSPPNK
jgi:hypothetical protein